MKLDTRGPADLEVMIEYLQNQNEFLKKKLRDSVNETKSVEKEYEKLLEENNTKSLLINTVHDSIVADVYPGEEGIVASCLGSGCLKVVQTMKEIGFTKKEYSKRHHSGYLGQKSKE